MNKYRTILVKFMQVIEMKTKLEEKIKTLEKEKSMLLEEVKQLREVVELNEKAKILDNEVSKLKKEVKALKEKLPKEFLQELGEYMPSTSEGTEEEETCGDKCLSCDEEDLL